MTNEPAPKWLDVEAALLAHVSAADYQPAKPRVIAERLGLDVDQRAALRKAVKRLNKAGQLAYGSSHIVFPAGAVPTGRVIGMFRRVAAGHGYVRPQDASPSDERDRDIYIAADRAHDASSGDTVLVRLLNSPRFGARNQQQGEVVEILERQTNSFVGTYFEERGAGYVRVDGTIFSQSIYVGDPGAKGAAPDDKVVLEILRFPSHYQDGEGVITEVLGARGTPGVDTLSIIREFALPEAFAEDALEEARREAEQFDEGNLSDRLDLTAETIITIDPVDARDFDDAISLATIDRGHWRLGVHIADVSHFVRPKTALDREALDRATSVYLPDRVLPMLPEVISNGLASLQPDRVRYTKTVFIEFTAEGQYVGADLHSAAIKSARRFSYEEVDSFLADREAWRSKLTPAVFALLERMHELAMILRRRRFERGALELSLREIKVDLDRQGAVVGAHAVVNTESHQVIEEFMLSANEAVATRLHAAELGFLRRVHEAPAPRKLKALTQFVSELGITTESLESRFELQKLLAAVHGLPEEQAVNYAVLRSLQQAHYSPAEEGHYALSSECYCHFTSPIRRYPDLTIHRLIDSLIRKRKVKTDLEKLYELGQHCSTRERRAEAAERELNKVKLLNLLAQQIGREFSAVITGVQEFGIFALGLELPAEGLIHVSSLHDDFYQYDRATHTLAGRRAGNAFRLGDVIEVAVARVDVERRELDYRLAGSVGQRPTRSGESSAGPPRSGSRGSQSKSRGNSAGHGKSRNEGKRRQGR